MYTYMLFKHEHWCYRGGGWGTAVCRVFVVVVVYHKRKKTLILWVLWHENGGVSLDTTWLNRSCEQTLTWSIMLCVGDSEKILFLREVMLQEVPVILSFIRTRHTISVTTALHVVLPSIVMPALLTLKVLNVWKVTSYCSLKPLWLGMGQVVSYLADPTSPPTVRQLSRLAL